MNKKTLTVAAGLAGLVYLLTRRARAVPTTPTTPTQGTLDITCPTAPVGVSSTGTASIIVTATAIGGNVAKTLKIVAGSFIDSKLVTLTAGQTSIVTFIVTNVTQNTNYTVSVI